MLESISNPAAGKSLEARPVDVVARPQAPVQPEVAVALADVAEISAKAESQPAVAPTPTPASPATAALAMVGGPIAAATPAPPETGKKYLNIFWNQHQPSYKDEASDSFTQPWVRLHATKDYYDMAAELINFPNVHVTINLSSSLLRQLDEYCEKLYAFGDVSSPRQGDLSAYPIGHVDRYMDLLVKPVDQWSEQDRQFAVERFFDADYRAQIAPFPAYKALKEKHGRGERLSDQDLRDLKVWFHVSWMDPIFREGDVPLVGDTVDGKPMEPAEAVTAIDDLVKKGSGFTEDDAKQVALETYKIMKYVVPIHRHVQNRIAPDGQPQVEVVTTPFYHPILPLLHDATLASQASPGIPLPNPA
ncbi:MAG: hypothetical protein FJX76_28425, partial [Armatimonadetes bacterium]|nr:hypothetical protein [Armatimonadota bacterium]